MTSAAKYRRAFALGMQQALEYRVNFLLHLTSSFFQIFIQLFLWTAVYRSTGGGILFGYTYQQMMLYTVIAGLLNRLVRTGFESEVAEDIKSGGLSKYIVRPVGHFTYRLSVFLGLKSAQTGLVSLLLLAAAVAVARLTGLPIPPSQLVWFVPAFLLAFVINFILFYAVSAIGFWLSDIGFFFEAVRIVFILLSGGIFPLSVFGRAERLFIWLPFRYTINFPVDVLTGRVAGREAFAGIAAQLLWIALLFGISRIVWSRGMRKFVAVGG